MSGPFGPTTPARRHSSLNETSGHGSRSHSSVLKQPSSRKVSSTLKDLFSSKDPSPRMATSPHKITPSQMHTSSHKNSTSRKSFRGESSRIFEFDSPSELYSRESPEPVHQSSPGATQEPSEASDYETHDDPIELIDELDDLQQASTRMLNLLISDHKRPALAVKFAHETRLAGPNHPNNRRLAKLVAKLSERIGKFTGTKFIDVLSVVELIPSLVQKDKPFWAPDPIFYSANCARLALEVLFTTPTSENIKRTVRTLEGIFPSSFIPSQVSEKLEGAVFNLALDIRTHFFIAELERRQEEEDFNPAAVLQQVFKQQVGSKDNFVRYIRGFASASQFVTKDNRMPTRFHDKVLERVQELEDLLLIVVVNGKLDITELMSAYPWTRLVFNTARLLATVTDNLKASIKSQPSVDDVIPDLIKKINDQAEGHDFGNTMKENPPVLSEIEENSHFDTTLAGSETLVDSFHLEDRLASPDNDVSNDIDVAESPVESPRRIHTERPSKSYSTQLETDSPSSTDEIYETILKGRQQLLQSQTHKPRYEKNIGDIFAPQRSATRVSPIQSDAGDLYSPAQRSQVSPITPGARVSRSPVKRSRLSSTASEARASHSPVKRSRADLSPPSEEHRKNAVQRTEAITRPTEAQPQQTAWAARNTAPDPVQPPLKPPRQGHRGFWSKEEDQRLLDLLAVHPYGWIKILEADKDCPAADGGPVFKPIRSAQSIKDRARTLARGCYDSGQPLPPQLLGISLGKNYPKNPKPR